MGTVMAPLSRLMWGVNELFNKTFSTTSGLQDSPIPSIIVFPNSEITRLWPAL